MKLPKKDYPKYLLPHTKAIKAIYLGKCVDGRQMHHRPHAHNQSYDRHFGTICFDNKKHLLTKKVGLHELAHILAPNTNHGIEWMSKLVELGSQKLLFEEVIILLKHYDRLPGGGVQKD